MVRLGPNVILSVRGTDALALKSMWNPVPSRKLSLLMPKVAPNKEAAKEFYDQGRSVRLIFPAVGFGDFNDVLRSQCRNCAR